MSITFPATPIPSTWTLFREPFTAPVASIFYVGDTITFTLNQSGPDAYTVRDWFGTVVSSGSMSGTTISPAAPSGGWDPGWYRIWLTGPVNDAVYGDSYGAQNFIVIRDTAGFEHIGVSTDPGGGEARDVMFKGVLGIGTSRLQITNTDLCDPDDPYQPGTVGDQGFKDSMYACKLAAQDINTYKPEDPVRPWQIMCQFPNGAIDWLRCTSCGDFMVADPDLDGDTIFVATGPGTSSGYKVRVFSPDSSTLVETFDNIADSTAAETAINGVSDYVKFFHTGGAGFPTASATAIGTEFRTGLINAVQYLYPEGVTRFEGPYNEPLLNEVNSERVAHECWLFADGVHTGHASAKAIGPCCVSITNLDGWDLFFAAGGGTHLDEISTHAYDSQTNGDKSIVDYWWPLWRDKLSKYDQQDKPVWVTESTQQQIPVYGVYHPQNATKVLQVTLQMEKYGVPRHRNLYWYDTSHGFWGAPNWLRQDDGSPEPMAVMYRVLAEETWGKLWHHPIDFGSVQANHIFSGSVYTSPTDDTSTAVISTVTAMADTTVTLQVVDADVTELVTVDGLGREGTVTLTGDEATVDVSHLPVYLRLPAGVKLRVLSCNDWGETPPPSISQAAQSFFSTDTPSPRLSDNAFVTNYASGLGFVESTAALPDTATLVFGDTVEVDRVIVVCAHGSQAHTTLADFDVQTSADGTTGWTTRATVTKTDLTVLEHPTAATNAGCTWETYWDNQWIFDVDLGGTFSAKGVRVYARESSYGGEPTSDGPDAGLGQGTTTQALHLQEIIVPSASTPSLFVSDYAELVTGTAGLIGFWRLSEDDGETTAATETNSPTLDGTYANTWTSVAGPLADGVTARQTSASPAATLTIPGDALLAVGDTFTIEFWHNPYGNSGSGGQIIGQGIGVNWPIVEWQNGTVGLVFNDGAGTVATATTDYTDGNWHYVVITKTGADTHIYLDGLDVTDLDTNNTFNANVGNVTLSPTGAANNGWANLAIYNTVVAPEDVLERYYAAYVPITVPIPNPTVDNPVPTLIL